MYKIETFQETYEDLPLTNFPVSEDTFERMMDITISMYPLIKQYNEYFSQGNLSACNNLLANNPDLQKSFQNADKYNQLRDGLIAMQRFLLTEVDELYHHVAQSAIGINDNPTEDEKSTVSYSAEKVDNMFNKYHTMRTITIPASGWNDNFPYINTVTVEGITSETDLKVIGVYIPENATLEQIKSWNKAAGLLIENEDATTDNSVTFKAYKKPTVDFMVITEGG